MLFGLDDGARTLDESVAMVRMAAEHGTTDLVATPHANLSYCFEPEQIADRLARVEEAAGGALRLYTGCDFHLSYENIQDAIDHPRKYTIRQKNYLLVEFSELLIFKNCPLADAARERYQKVYARFASEPGTIDLAGARVLRQRGREYEVLVNGNAADVLSRLQARSPEALTTEALTLEEIFVATLHPGAVSA